MRDTLITIGHDAFSPHRNSEPKCGIRADPPAPIQTVAMTFACRTKKAVHQVSSYLVPCICLISPKVSSSIEYVKIRVNVTASKHVFARGRWQEGENALCLKYQCLSRGNILKKEKNERSVYANCQVTE